MHLRIGRLAGVMVDAIRFCFPVVAEGTPLEGADLLIEEPEGRGRCLDCGTEFPQESLFTPCPCGSRRVERIAGEELLVAGFELETAVADNPSEGG